MYRVATSAGAKPSGFYLIKSPYRTKITFLHECFDTSVQRYRYQNETKAFNYKVRLSWTFRLIFLM